MRKHKLILFTNKVITPMGAALLGVVFLFLPHSGEAINIGRQPEVKVFDSSNLSVEVDFMAYAEGFRGGGTVAVCDVTGNGVNNIITGAGSGGGPHVRVFDNQGNFLSGFFVYAESFRNGVNVACGDLDGDGLAEIVTGAGVGGGPHVRVFDSFGNPKFTPGFFAFDNHFRGGVNVAVGDVDGDGLAEIVTGAGVGGFEVKVFNRFGESQDYSFEPFDKTFLKGGIIVATANVDGGVEDEIVMGVYKFGELRIKVYKYNSQKTILADFLAWPESMHGGISLAAGDFDENGVDELAVGVGAQGGPQIRFYRGGGEEFRPPFFAYEEDFRGGISLAVGNISGSYLPEVVTLPRRLEGNGNTKYYKYIEIDISDQTLAYYESGIELGKTRVSSGMSGMDTPLGEFKIMNKISRAYSSKYNLYMPFWMQFTSSGHGLHELPEWSNGYKEGQNHLGIRVSHGCVRLGVGPAEELYNWAEVGTPIVIQW